jgi:hypothetical protein
MWPPYFGGDYNLGCYDVGCVISLVIPLVCGSVNERVDCIISSILSLALPLGRLVADVLDKFAEIFSVSPVVLRGGVLDRLTSFAACQNLIFPLSTNLSSCGDFSISPVIFVVVVGVRELACDVSGPDYPLSTDMSSSWRLLPRCLLLAWWLPRPLTPRRHVSERALSALDVPVERVASVAVLPVTCVVVLGKPARGRDVSEPYSSVLGDLSSSWRLFFLLLDTCWG